MSSNFTGRISQYATFRLPDIDNERMKTYPPNSDERNKLQAALSQMKSETAHVPCVINGKRVNCGNAARQVSCGDIKHTLCTFDQVDAPLLKDAISGALAAKAEWESMPFNDRAAIFLKAADLLTHKYRYKVMAATMLGQGKTCWQAEIEAAAELADFWRFNCKYAQDLYAQQPEKNAPGVWNRVEYRPLDGFVAAISPFNFTAIGGNLPGAPALMGNVVIWKPSPDAIYSNYLIYEILMEAGLPDGVIQFVPSSPTVFHHKDFAGVHFTGSTAVFKEIWKTIAINLDSYRSYPRIVGETGGKNMHFVHESANIKNVVNQTIRSAFEYQGQKCSACSRLYVPENIWEEVKTGLLAERDKIRVGDVSDFENHMSAVINEKAFKKISQYIEYAKNNATILAGGNCDSSKGYFIEPTIVQTNDPQFKTMCEEIFGPVLTVFVYPRNEFEKYLKIAEKTSQYALTGSFFADDREVIIKASKILQHAMGNFYINDKSTGAVVGQQPFGGGRMSGTNDKAGSALNLLRWVSPRTIKENFIPLESWDYPSNKI